LKAACSQGIVAPVWMFLKMFLLSGHSFKDVKLGWLIYVVFEGQYIHVIHQKKEQSNHDEEDPPRSPGEFDFEFTWELKMSFDLDLEKMVSASFGVSSFTVTKFCESSLGKKLEKKVKAWHLESFLSSEMQIIEKARVSSNMKQQSQTSFAPSTYDEFKKAVAKETGASRANFREIVTKSEGPRSKSRSPRGSTSSIEEGSIDKRRKSIQERSVGGSVASSSDLPWLSEREKSTSESATTPKEKERSIERSKSGGDKFRTSSESVEKKRPKSPSRTRGAEKIEKTERPETPKSVEFTKDVETLSSGPSKSEKADRSEKRKSLDFSSGIMKLGEKFERRKSESSSSKNLDRQDSNGKS